MLLKSVLMGFLSFHSVDTTMLKECENHADKISGCVERWYYKNGNLWSETPFKNDKIEGIEKWYYENGNLKEEIPYKNGKTHGDVKYYTENGKLLALVKAENKFISGKCFNNKVLTDKELRNLKDFEIAYLFDDVINYLQEICLKESDSK